MPFLSALVSQLFFKSLRDHFSWNAYWLVLLLTLLHRKLVVKPPLSIDREQLRAVGVGTGYKLVAIVFVYCFSQMVSFVTFSSESSDKLLYWWVAWSLPPQKIKNLLVKSNTETKNRLNTLRDGLLERFYVHLVRSCQQKPELKYNRTKSIKSAQQVLELFIKINSCNCCTLLDWFLLVKTAKCDFFVKLFCGVLNIKTVCC